MAFPYRADFLAGQYFDIRLEVHSPINGSEARVGEPDPNFTFTIAKKGKTPVPATDYFGVQEPVLERWQFSWYEGELGLFSWQFKSVAKKLNIFRSLRQGCEEALSGQCYRKGVQKGGPV